MRFPQKKLISSSSGSLQSLDDLDIFPDLGLYVFGKFQKKLKAHRSRKSIIHSSHKESHHKSLSKDTGQSGIE
jgi:hypothetical protein